MKHKNTLHLYPNFFTEVEKNLYHSKACKITTFTYKSGVEALRITIGKGEFVWLPYLGQQLWDWKVEGETIKFSGFMEEPSYHKTFLENYGAFLIHCGVTGMGNPKEGDTHLHHGELPVATFDEAWIEFDVNNTEFPISLCGSYRYKIPFKGHYVCNIKTGIAFDGLSATSQIDIKNNSHSPLEYMYLAHINFAFDDATTIEYHDYPFIPSALRIIGEDEYKNSPTKLLTLDDRIVFDPEVVAILHHKEGKGEFTSTLKKKDGSTCWVTQKLNTLDHTVAWMTHNDDRGACGFALPATAGPEGKTIETKLGNVKTLPHNEEVSLQFSFGISLPE